MNGFEKGIYKQMNEEKVKLEIDEYFKNHPELQSFMTNTKWEEDGQKFSSWKIKAGTTCINTGDGGAELFLKTFQEQIEKEFKNKFGNSKKKS